MSFLTVDKDCSGCQSVVTHLNHSAVSTLSNALTNRCHLELNYTEYPRNSARSERQETTDRPSWSPQWPPRLGAQYLVKDEWCWWLDHHQTPGSVIPLGSFILIASEYLCGGCFLVESPVNQNLLLF